ncbi:hypothetical protein PAECIP111893_02171 [Paenibacillus plantiphilus]|uniref:LysM domain-containing protein n=1 Tax=Paenibacillus plantiphilus TaxID=2905650 RepID=A0ABM9C7M4_9BACL|nr:LysM peptidoglycan-binding domain-containing protein [Paenibacillus plantiphilus]CAH1204168.1 hypothetical protein PAECIP111893_02171 [Paenibacillus plantiphilus]
MSNGSNGLRFDVYERVHLPDDMAAIDELEEIELVPRIQIVQQGEQVLLKGHLLLTGIYRAQDDPSVEQPLEHWIPVEITLPMNRVHRLDDISVEIDNFDVELLSSRTLNITGVLSLLGIELEKQPQQESWQREEPFTVVHRREAEPEQVEPFSSLDQWAEPSVPVTDNDLEHRTALELQQRERLIQEAEAREKALQYEAESQEQLLREAARREEETRAAIRREESQRAAIRREEEEREALARNETEREVARQEAEQRAAFFREENESGSAAQKNESSEPVNSFVQQPEPERERFDSGANMDETGPQNSGSDSFQEAATPSAFHAPPPISDVTSAELDNKKEIRVALVGKSVTAEPDPAASGLGIRSLLQSSKREQEARAIAEQSAQKAAEEANKSAGDDIEWKNIFFGQSIDESFRKLRICIVQREETLELIAGRYQLQPREIALYNRLSDGNITEGQVLYIP